MFHLPPFYLSQKLFYSRFSLFAQRPSIYLCNSNLLSLLISKCPSSSGQFQQIHSFPHVHTSILDSRRLRRPDAHHQFISLYLQRLNRRYTTNKTSLLLQHNITALSLIFPKTLIVIISTVKCTTMCFAIIMTRDAIILHDDHFYIPSRRASSSGNAASKGRKTRYPKIAHQNG